MKSNYLSILLFASILTSTSCQNDLYIETNDREEGYTQAFIKEFGLIDPDHNWGFSDLPASRACNTNGATEWVLPDAVTPYEREAVRMYLNQADKSKIKTVASLNYTKYYITHVYANPHEVSPLKGDSFKSAEKMNYLVVGETSTCDVITGGESAGCCHINDFNAAQNSDFKGHMVMYDSGTYDFAYHNSYNTANYNNYIIIAGADVDEFMEDETYSGSDTPISLAKHFYVCFDYMSRPVSSNTVARYRVDFTYKDGEETKTGTQQVLEYIVTDENDYSTLPSEDWFKTEIKNKVGLSVNISDISITNYSTLAVEYQNADKWVNADGIYDDWVVRIIGNAKRLNEDDTEIGTTSTSDEEPVEEFAHRIMVEDLSVAANYEYGVSSSDWDFNDLVFDAKIDASGKATIKIMALGGTLPIFIADKDGTLYDKELHRCFIDTDDSYKIMINTNAGPGLSPVTLSTEISHLTFDPENYNSIRVFAEIDGILQEIEANHGKPTGKICVPVKKRWMGEKRNIKLDNPGFEEWVNNQSKNDWMYSNN